MDMNLNQNIKQEQKLLLTYEMKMSLQLLQMPIDELQECIEKELDENPILEINYDVTEDASEDDSKDTDEKSYIETESFDYDKFLLQPNSHDNYKGEISFNDAENDNDNNPFNYIAQTPSLKDYMAEQLIDRKEGKEIRNICEYLIECIDDDGFITEDLHEVAINTSNAYELVHTALEIIKDLQPWGIGAKDFKESLIIQLHKKNCYEIKIEDIIMKHLELLAGNKLKELAKILGVTLEAVQKYVNIIKSLEPKPARGFFTGEEIGYIVPEAFLKKIGNEYYIIMNDDMLPKLNVNSYYQRIMKEDNSQEAVGFMKDKVSSALALIKGIEQRRSTIYRIIEKIIEYQKDYFDKGDAYLKPMNLKDLAADLNLHESTVSRAVKDKYICVMKGTIKLKDLFTNGINQGIGQEDISTNIIKKEISQLVKKENKYKPLSDQAICDLLKKEKMDISRRTVAKYREELGIRTSGKRKIF